MEGKRRVEGLLDSGSVFRHLYSHVQFNTT